MINENFYYFCIYDIWKDRRYPRQKTPKLNHLTAKIIRLHSKRVQSITIDKHEAILFQPSFSHLLHMPKRRVSRIITAFIEKEGVPQTTNSGILHTFMEFMQSKYEPIHVDDAWKMEKAGHRTLPFGWKDFLDIPITEEELKTGLSRGACNKAPVRDDVCLELLKVK